MLKTLKRARDRFLGIGEADTSVPVLDGSLKPNNLLEQAPVLFEHDGLDDMVVDAQQRLLVSAGNQLLALDETGQQTLVHEFDTPIQALATYGEGVVAATAQGLWFVGGQYDGKHVESLKGAPATSVNALHQGPGGSLLVSIGSVDTPANRWAADLLAHGKSGQVLEFFPDTDSWETRAKNLSHSFGVCTHDDRILVAESWAHRLLIIDGKSTKVGPSHLPGYPSRIVQASGGGYWLTVFAPRSQLLELVLREDAFRSEMMQTIEPKYWIAPALSSGQDFLEPLQHGGVRQMGILKPWAPARSYGLVVRLGADLSLLYSAHSRVGGRHHGITAATEFAGALMVLSKGAGRILRVSLEELKQQG